MLNIRDGGINSVQIEVPHPSDEQATQSQQVPSLEPTG